MQAAAPYLIMFIIGITGSAFWVPNCEASLIAVANVERIPDFRLFGQFIDLGAYHAHLPFLLAFATALGSTVGGSLLYLMGRGILKISKRVRKKIDSLDMSKYDKIGAAVIFTASAASIPPVTFLSIAAGIVNYSFLKYFFVSLAGRIVRFSIVVYASESIVKLLLHLKLF